MKFTLSLILVTAVLVAAQHDMSIKLVKPPLVSNIGYLEEGLDLNLRETTGTFHAWDTGHIPKDCYDIAKNEGKNPEDFITYNVAYEDCADPWVFCYHNESEITAESMMRQFGKLPIQMRQYVKHVVTIPAEEGSAYETGGNIVFFRPVDNMTSVIIHETGHSLDLNGAYGPQLSSSDNWWNNYKQDSNVPDPYAQSNAIENVAQNTVLAVYNENVKGGYASIEPRSVQVFHQFATVITVARENGRGNSILNRGEARNCTHRIPSSDPVVASNSRPRLRRNLVTPPDVRLKTAHAIVIPARNPKIAGKRCKLTW